MSPGSVTAAGVRLTISFMMSGFPITRSRPGRALVPCSLHEISPRSNRTNSMNPEGSTAA